MSTISHLECAVCGQRVEAVRPQTTCARDGGMLLARYNLDAVRRSKTQRVPGGSNSMWRYAEMLPASASPVTLAEGRTPLLRSRTDAGLWIKNEGANPTGSLEDRGMSVAVSALRNYGVQNLAIASLGDSATALAAYCAAAGLNARCFIPQDAELAIRAECSAHGAEVTLVDGTLEDCARAMHQATANQDCFALLDGGEPFRPEGEKTLACEIAEQLGWRVPDAIIVATGSGTVIVAIWKALQELGSLGLIDVKRPRLIAVQPAGCAPIARAFAADSDDCEPWSDPRTVASELRVAAPRAGSVALKALRESHGLAVPVTDEEMLTACSQLARAEGVFAAPEGGAAYAAYRNLRATGLLRQGEEVVVVNTRSGLKCPELFERDAHRGRKPLPRAHTLGGIIQPY